MFTTPWFDCLIAFDVLVIPSGVGANLEPTLSLKYEFLIFENLFYDTMPLKPVK